MLDDLHIREKHSGDKGAQAMMSLCSPQVEIKPGACETCTPNVLKHPLSQWKLFVHQYDCRNQITREMEGE
jgi:hypothetical protein